MALQQMLEDQLFYNLMSYVERNISDEWRQCFPFERLLRIIADFLTGPDGLFKYIEQFVNAHLANLQAGAHFGFNSAKKFKMIDVTALDRLIAILEAIRDAILNFELCIEADFSEDVGPDLQTEDTRGGRPIFSPFGLNRTFTGNQYQFEAEGLGPGQDTDQGDQLARQQIGRGTDGTGVVFPTDTEIKAFITNRLGESPEFADQVLATSKRSSDISGRAAGSSTGQGGGTDDNSTGGFANQIERAIGDCSRTLDPNRILELSKLMSEWDIKI